MNIKVDLQEIKKIIDWNCIIYALNAKCHHPTLAYLEMYVNAKNRIHKAKIKYIILLTS